MKEGGEVYLSCEGAVEDELAGWLVDDRDSDLVTRAECPIGAAVRKGITIREIEIDIITVYDVERRFVSRCYCSILRRRIERSRSSSSFEAERQLADLQTVTTRVAQCGIVRTRVNVVNTHRHLRGRVAQFVAESQHESPDHGCQNNGNGNHQDDPDDGADCTIVACEFCFQIHGLLSFVDNPILDAGLISGFAVLATGPLRPSAVRVSSPSRVL